MGKNTAKLIRQKEKRMRQLKGEIEDLHREMFAFLLICLILEF